MPLGKCPESNWVKPSWESVRMFEARQHQEWRSNLNGMIKRFLAVLESQIGLSWTVDAPTNQPYSSYLDVGMIMPRVRDRVETARKSEEFHGYLDSLSRELGRIKIIKKCELTVLQLTAQSGHHQDPVLSPLCRFSCSQHRVLITHGQSSSLCSAPSSLV